jgi:nitrate/nitrite transporter NarK
MKKKNEEEQEEEKRSSSIKLLWVSFHFKLGEVYRVLRNEKKIYFFESYFFFLSLYFISFCCSIAVSFSLPLLYSLIYRDYAYCSNNKKMKKY